MGTWPELHAGTNFNYVWDAAGLVWVKETQPGGGGGAGTQYTEDAAAAADPVGNAVILVRKDAPSATVSADGDNIAQRGSNYGAGYVTLLGETGLVTNPATAINQEGEMIYLSNIDANLNVGIALAAKQDTGNVSLASIDGTRLVNIATNQGTMITSLGVMDDWDEVDRCKVNPIAGQVGVQGASGVVNALTQRVVLATDVALPTGTNTIGAVNGATYFGKTITFVPVAQGAAGTTVLAAASVGKKHKIVGAILTLSAAGTLKFTDGSGDLTGAMDVATQGGFVLPTGILPYFETTITNTALSIVTVTGAAKGVVAILSEA